MFARVLGTSAARLNEEVFQSLVTNRAVEHQRLEYKSRLPGPTPDDRREFARDIAGMANGGGGILIFGVEDDANDAAIGLTPVGLGGEVTRLSQICGSLIEPYLRVEFHELQVQGGPDGIIVVEVPSSERKPFAVVEGSRLGFYRRAGRSKHPLTEAEVAQMYRARTERLAETNQRIDTLTAQVLERVGEARTPAVYVVIAPREVYDRLFRPDRETRAGIRALDPPPVFGTSGVGDVFFDELRPGFKRIDMARHFDDRSLERYGWIEFHDDGAFVGVVRGDESLHRGLGNERGTDEGATGGFYDSRLTCEIVARLAAFGILARHFDVHGEVVIRVGIAPVGLPATITTGRDRWEADFTEVVQSPLQTSLSAEADDLEAIPGVLQIAAPLLDDLMTAFGWPRCLQLDRDGTVRLRFWGSGWTENIDRWARSLAIETSAEA